ncbi:MAG: RNA polymerase sigma factor [Planctomycetes bacterium]|nr:RNA polymerase sigma factor [Planctomycetota bacterium]
MDSQPQDDPRAQARAEDDRLVARALGGDGQAFEALYERHRHTVFKVAFGMTRNPEDALDIVQETFLKAHRSLGRFERRASVVTWLCQIAVHLAIDLSRRRKVRQAEPLDERLVADGVEGPSQGGGPAQAVAPPQGAQARELQAALDQALAKLSEKHRTVFVLYTVKGLSYKEIADAVGISIGTVMSRLFYARKNLQAMLGEFAPS